MKQQNQLNKLKSKFTFLGKFMAKAIMDSRVLDLPLSTAFYKLLVDKSSVCEDDLKHVDASLASSVESLRDYVRQRRHLIYEMTTRRRAAESNRSIEDLEKKLAELEKTVADLDLDFTLPGYPSIELKARASPKQPPALVTLDNLDEYIRLVVEWTLHKGVAAQLDAFREGFSSILPASSVFGGLFFPDELDRLVCGAGYQRWDLKLLAECTRCDHGYTHESKAVQNLFDIMCSFDAHEQRLFLQFITGSPRLPIGGLRSLVPQLTIVRKTPDSMTTTASSSSPSSGSQHNNASDNYLPSVMTCVNYLKLPEYSSIDIMRDKLTQAMRDGQLSFHLS